MPLAYEKPHRVFDRDREWRSLADFVADDRAEPTLGIVSGRRRQGKTYLLRSLAEAAGGFFFEAAEATEAESLRMFGAALARHAGSGVAFSFASWDDALRYLFDMAAGRPVPLVIDEFPYLIKSSPVLPALIRQRIDEGQVLPGVPARLLLCGSAMSVMGRLLGGSAPLRGRAGLEMIVQPLAFRDAALFWGADAPDLAVRLHAIVGGTPAYRRQFVRDDVPSGLADFDDWVVRAVLNPDRPLLREARYLLSEEMDVREPALYYSVLGAIAAGKRTWGGIANYIGRKSSDIAHPLQVLEDCQLVAKEKDAFRGDRTSYRITEPLIAFYEAVMRPRWSDLELGLGEMVWADARHTFSAQILGPHFEELCREFARREGSRTFGVTIGEVASGTVSDPERKQQIQIDVAVLGPERHDAPRQVISIGECKWGEVMGLRHVERLARARALLAVKGYDTSGTVLACYSGGFDADLTDAARYRQDLLLIGLDQLYSVN
jgi:AAA+ ATPase superfamily predicted ATPase